MSRRGRKPRLTRLERAAVKSAAAAALRLRSMRRGLVQLDLFDLTHLQRLESEWRGIRAAALCEVVCG